MATQHCVGFQSGQLIPLGKMSEIDAPPPTSAVLMSISKHIAVRCKKPNAAFIVCKKEDRNPEACLSQGNAVTSCTIDVYALSSI